jgi:2-amino-4-hydroxy-6-hydroxymethyldihydropteridine diphosphokinase
VRTAIALGSNLGDRKAALRKARDSILALHTGPDPAAVSPLYETAPVGCPQGSPNFLNAVIEIETSLQPHDLIDHLRALELAAGRPSHRAANSPRPLDLDILHCGSLALATPHLVVPHPRMACRRFVLQPLAEINPRFVLPGGSRTVAELLAALPPEPAVTLVAHDW